MSFVSMSRPANVLLSGSTALLWIGFAVWLVYSVTGYGQRYSQAADGWRRGGTHLIEITLIREDEVNLSCASDLDVGGLHCGYRRNKTRFNPPGEDDAHELRPYNTVKSKLFLGAGLWSSPALQKPLPATRFTVACNFRVVGVVKSAALRWQPKGRFEALKQSVAAGKLTDCYIPQ